MSREEPHPMPEGGLTTDQLNRIPVTELVDLWRENPEYVCRQCGGPSYIHPYTNWIWGCRRCVFTTASVSIYFIKRSWLAGEDMTKDKLAKTLNGREIGAEITATEHDQAKKDGLVVIFGASDDLCELRGAINDEVGCFDGGTLFIANGKVLPPVRDEDDDADILRKYDVLELVQSRRKSAIKIEAVWCEDGTEYSWTYKTDHPHATFDIMEGNTKFCRGIVISLQESSGAHGAQDGSNSA